MSWILPSRIEAIVLIGALARLGAVQNPILPIYRHREVGFITRQTGCELLVVPGTFRGFDYEKMARRSDRGPRRRGPRRRSRPARGRSRHARPARERRRRPAALALLHVGHDRRPEGRAAHRREHRRPPTSAMQWSLQLRSHRQGRGGLPDHPRRRRRLAVQRDGDRRRAAARRGLQRRGLRPRSSPGRA